MLSLQLACLISTSSASSSGWLAAAAGPAAHSVPGWPVCSGTHQRHRQQPLVSTTVVIGRQAGGKQHGCVQLQCSAALCAEVRTAEHLYSLLDDSSSESTSTWPLSII